jgi:hypothetical protein
MTRTERTPPPRTGIVPAAAPSSALDRARQERFQRQLVPHLWEPCSDEERAALQPPSPPTGPPEEQAPGDGGEHRDHEPPPREDGAATEPPAPAAPAVQQAPAWQPPAAAPARNERGGRDGGDGRPGTGAAAPVQAAPAAGDAPPWLHDMVDQVAMLCAQGDQRFQHWSLTLPLDPAVLPDSELRLGLSPGAMTLRFRSGSPQAAALVCRYRDELHGRLAALPSSPPEIDIDLE